MRAPLFLALTLPLLTFGAATGRDTARQPERDRMVEKQIIARDISDERLLAALRKVPRHLFVPEDVRPAAYNDSPLPIGHGQTISQPFIVAYMTEVARIERDTRILEIGTGSGYQAAIAAELSDHVYSIEIVPELAVRAAQTLESTGYERVHLRQGDGYHGWPDAAPFDVIIVTAAANTIPPPLIAQLAENGRMIIPVGPQFGAQNLILVTKQNGKIRTRTLMPVAFVPFTREKR